MTFFLPMSAVWSNSPPPYSLMVVRKSWAIPGPGGLKEKRGGDVWGFRLDLTHQEVDGFYCPGSAMPASLPSGFTLKQCRRCGPSCSVLLFFCLRYDSQGRSHSVPGLQFHLPTFLFLCCSCTASLAGPFVTVLSLERSLLPTQCFLVVRSVF